jgi:hypothetical protein
MDDKPLCIYCVRNLILLQSDFSAARDNFNDATWSGPPACNGGILAAVIDLHTRARWQECHRLVAAVAALWAGWQ